MAYRQHLKAIVPILAVAAHASCGHGSHGQTEQLAAFNDKPVAVVVGTIHKHHLTTKEYPIQVLAHLLHVFKPDLLLVEIRPSAFKKGHFDDGPFEMTYVTRLAQRAGITVAPIDWWREEDVGVTPPPVDKAEAGAFKKEMAAFENRYTFPPSSFEETHSTRRTRLLVEGLTLQARYFQGSPRWNRRQHWFHFHTTAAISKFKPKRVMAFVGNQHRPELEAHLFHEGFRLVNPVSLRPRFRSDASAQQVPIEIIRSWQAGITRMRALTRRLPPVLAGSYAKKIRYFEVAVQRRGLCCAKPAAFDLPAQQQAADAGFPAADAQQVGIDQEALNKLLKRARSSNSDALVVLKDGKLVGQWHFGKPEGRIELMSVTKSIVSIVVGQLIDQGKIKSLDVPVHQYYPEWRQGTKKRITIRHIMNHTSGIQEVKGTAAEIYPSPNLVKLALAAELSSAPGKRFSYNNKATNLLAGIIQKATGRSMNETVAELLFRPLGIADFSWMKDKAGNPHVMAGLQLRSMDLAKIGQLLVGNGVWRGKRIVSQKWIKESTAKLAQDWMAPCGLLWWLEYKWTKSTIDQDLLQRWRTAGMSRASLRKLTKLKDVILTHSEYEARIARLFGGRTGMQKGFRSQLHGVADRKIVSGPLVGFRADGWLGQYLVVLPKQKLVAVRLMRAPKDSNSKHFDERKIDSFKDFTKLVMGLVRNQ